MKPRHRVGGILLLVLAAIMIAGGSMAAAQMLGVGEVPFQQAWASSGHADAGSEAFVHWDAEGAVPTGCAKCHSTPGYLDFVGMDGTATGEVNNPAPIGTTVQCIACHNDAARLMTEVTFPSGETLTGFEESARCAQCHQGRASKVQVDAAIESAGVAGQEDTVAGNLGFVNIHYFAAAATLFGSQAKGGYEYDGFSYMGRFDHVPGYDTCADCHDPHSLELKVGECAGCHTGVSSVEDVRNIRMQGSMVDYDGDGNTEEGIRGELETLQGYLLQAIQAYGREVAGTPIMYNAAAHPYWFVDDNGNGQADEGETTRFASFTPRLEKAAYNYQVSVKDPGAYAHNAKYMIQLVFDSIVMLNERISNPVNIDPTNRLDAGHFEFTSEAFQHWDEDGEVEANCARCHSAEGLVFEMEHGVSIGQEPSGGLACSTCHNSNQNFGLRYVGPVTFPSGEMAAFADPNANVCIVCHQGRESTVSVNQAIDRSGAGDDTVSTALSFRNPHYFAAGATRFGSEVHGAYEYARFSPHVSSFDSCVECHDVHALDVNVSACATCHPGVEDAGDLRSIRIGSPADYDGDGNTTEGIALEIETMHGALMDAIQAYAENVIGTPVGMDPHRHPYWFVDDNNNGVIDENETTRYASFTPRLLRAAYNYTWVLKDPGAFAHNNDYILQVMYDSIQDIGGSTAGLVRP